MSHRPGEDVREEGTAGAKLEGLKHRRRREGPGERIGEEWGWEHRGLWVTFRFELILYKRMCSPGQGTVPVLAP